MNKHHNHSLNDYSEYFELVDKRSHEYAVYDKHFAKPEFFFLTSRKTNDKT